MIRKKQPYKPDKKVNPFIGALLFLISILLLVLTGPLGFIYGIFYSFFTQGFKGIGEFLLKIAVSVDQLGNVLMQHLLNILWIKKAGYKFGNRDETISSVLGRNNKLKTLTGFGRAIDAFLDAIDPNHSLDSIDYYIEPTTEIHDTLVWIEIVDKRILCVQRENGTYNPPGGKRITGESDANTLAREIKATLNVILEIPTMEYIDTFEAKAAVEKPEILERATCYFARYQGQLQIPPDIGQIAWLSYQDREKVSLVGRLIFDYLNEKNQLD